MRPGWVLDGYVQKPINVDVLTAEVHPFGEASVKLSVNSNNLLEGLVQKRLRGDRDEVEIAHARDVVTRR